jgi:hypothetical protein
MKSISAKVQRGESFAVFKNSDLIFQINPATTVTLPKGKKPKEETTLHDVFNNMQITGKNKNTSQRIDDIVYKN